MEPLAVKCADWARREACVLANNERRFHDYALGGGMQAAAEEVGG